jgi:hypothetical protein
MAYLGAAMTFNHPFWDARTQADERNAWALVQKGMRARDKSPRERIVFGCRCGALLGRWCRQKVRARPGLHEGDGGGLREISRRNTKLFYALSILNTIEEGSPWSAQQALAARLIEQVYADDPRNPGALYYMIHAYDDPAHAARGLKAARAYAKAAPAVPHALHMPSHIFTRLGYWDESAATNEKAWQVSASDVKEHHESDAFCDFHSLNYLQYAYLQLGRYVDAKRVTERFAGQYKALSNRTTAPDFPDLEVRHLRGRTIYAIRDRVVFGYFDTLARYIMESGEWEPASTLPQAPTSRDFSAMRLQIDAMAAERRKDPSAARAAAEQLEVLAMQPGQRQLAQEVLTIEGKEAQAVAAFSSGRSSEDHRDDG